MTDVTIDRAVVGTAQAYGSAVQADGGEQVRLGYVPVQNAVLKNAAIVPMSLRSMHFVMPGGVDDLARPSGGNAYDRRICLDLPGFGWQVHKHTVAGSWPSPSEPARAELARTLRELPDGTVVLLDGLVACGVPEIILPEAERLCLAVLVHLPLGDETGLDPVLAAELDAKERATLRGVSAVIATSEWAVRRLVSHHGLAPERVHVAAPGADIAPLASGTDGVSRLLCVAAVTPRKGQHRLVEALATVTELRWSCVLVGGLDQEPEYVDHIRTLIAKFGLEDRFHLAGPQAARNSTPATPPPTSWSSPPTPRRTAWRSPRPSRAGSRAGHGCRRTARGRRPRPRRRGPRHPRTAGEPRGHRGGAARLVR